MKKPSRSAVMTSIPNHIAMDILMRLPVKPLLRFKCVSKSWYSLISDPIFIKLHLQFSYIYQKFVGPNSKLYFDAPSTHDLVLCKFTPIALPYEYMKQHYHKLCRREVLCCCDGLLLLDCYYGETETEHVILVWNPSTRECRELPKIDTHNSREFHYNIGYDSSTDDYNVMIETRDYHSSRRDLMFFSLKKSSSWRWIRDFKYDIRLKKCINLNGALHWLQRPHKNKIHCFSLAEETIMEIELPNNDDCSAGVVLGLNKLGIFQGCLCLSETISVDHSVSLNVWLMKEYGSWTKFITIPQLPLTDRRIRIPVAYHSMKKAIFIIKEVKKRKFVLYDLEKKEFDFNSHLKYGFWKKETFAESLVSPNYN